MINFSDPKDVHEVITYHNPDEDGIKSISEIRNASENLINVIAGCTPKCADQSAAIRKVREAMMTANAAVVLKGAV